MTEIRWLLLTALLFCTGCREDSSEGPKSTAPKRLEKSATLKLSVMFSEVAHQWGIEFANHVEQPEEYNLVAITGSGCAVLDIDRDGRLDVFFAGFENPNAPANRLFRQIETGNFQDVTAEFGLDQAPPSMGVAAGDFNNDGWPDLYLPSHVNDTLWLNEKGQAFVDVTASAGLQNIRWGAAASWVDYDRDGWLDLYVVNYVDYQHRPCIRLGGGEIDFCAPNLFAGTFDRLFRNVTGEQDAPAFEEVTQSSGVGSLSGRGLGVLSADFTDDGWSDFYVANDQGANRLWVNQRDGTFDDEAVIRGCAVSATGKPQASMGLAFVDLDANQHEDLLVSHLIQEPHALYLAQAGSFYREESSRFGISDATLPLTGFGLAVEDFALDGHLEVITANGHVNRSHFMSTAATELGVWEPYSQQLQVLRKTDTLRYAACEAFETPLPKAISRGLACGDLDGDGDLDLVVSNTASPSFVLENIAEKQRDWLIVRPIDPVHHGRTAYGAKLTITFSDESQRVRTFQPCASFSSTHAPMLHFSSSDDAQIESIDVMWPDGQMQLERFRIDQLNTTVELFRGQGRQVKE